MDAGSRSPSYLKVVGATAILAGLAVLVRLVPDYASDTGLGGSGASLKQHWRAIAAMAPAASAPFLGWRLLRIDRPRLPEPFGARHPVATTLLAVAAAATAPIAMQLYPRGSTATVVAFDTSGSERWRTTTPATTIHGIRSSTADEVIVEGWVDHRGCNGNPVSITLDRDTGRIVAVVELPSFYPDRDAIPPPPDPPSPTEYRFEQGESAVVCSSFRRPSAPRGEVEVRPDLAGGVGAVERVEV